jgi:hypothetical protein
MLAWGGPENEASAAMAMSSVSWREPPIAQPSQLQKVRTASCRTAAGGSLGRATTM